MSDRSNWWNLYRFDLAARTAEPLAPMAAEFGVPQWSLAAATYAFAGPDRIVCTLQQAGLGRLAVLDLKSKTLRPLDLPFTEFGSVRADGDRVLFRAAAPDHPLSIVALDLASGAHRILQKSTTFLDQPELRIADWLTTVKPVEFPTTDGKTAFGLFYPPHNPDYAGACKRKAAAPGQVPRRSDRLRRRARSISPRNSGPAAASRCSTSTTAAAPASAAPIASASTATGASSTSTTASTARNSSPRRAWWTSSAPVITGGSAGGYTTLAALVFRDFFQGGASYYGVSDVAALARDTHKFESRYLDWLIGPYPQEEARYRERSPLYHADRLSKPVIFFQGDEDAVVPPNQTEAMVEALRRKGNRGRLFPVLGRAARLSQGRQHPALPRRGARLLCDRGVQDRPDVNQKSRVAPLLFRPPSFPGSYLL